MRWLELVLSVGAGLLLLWGVLLLLLWRARPPDLTVREALRLLPDLVRLVRRLAADRSLPRGVRVRLWLLLAYLLSPVDLVPDVVPVLGYADDVVVVALALRSVVRVSGAPAVRRAWPAGPRVWPSSPGWPACPPRGRAGPRRPRARRPGPRAPPRPRRPAAPIRP